MPVPTTPDHDQRLKVLLKEFFEQFFLCFFPAWAARFDFGDVTWLDKEVFLAPPQGEKRQLDLVGPRAHPLRCTAAAARPHGTAGAGAHRGGVARERAAVPAPDV